MANVMIVSFSLESAEASSLSSVKAGEQLQNRRPLEPFVEASFSLTNSFVYQKRAIITALSIFTGWTLSLFSSPIVNVLSTQYLITCGYGGLCFISGVMLRLWATAAIGHRKQRFVVREGPYAYCRNPMYLGTFLIALSMAAFLQSLVFASFLLIPILLYVYGVVPAEERAMHSRFGAEYASYCQSTPRWSFQVRRRPSQGDFQWSPTAWNAEFRRCQCWCVLIVIALVSCQIRSADWWPH